MGTSNSKYNKTITIINNNQTTLPDIVLRQIVGLLSEYQCRYHRHKWNPLSLSLISHYWLVHIVAKTMLRITTTSLISDCKFFINFPNSYKRSLLKLNNLNSNAIQSITASTDNPNHDNHLNRKFSISKLTLIFTLNEQSNIRRTTNNKEPDVWVDYYIDTLKMYWLFNSLTLVNLPEDNKLYSLLYEFSILKLRIYTDVPKYLFISWHAVPNLKSFTLRKKNEVFRYPVDMPNIHGLAFQSLQSIALCLPLNNPKPLGTEVYPNIRKLELSHYHSQEWSKEQLQTSISISNQFPNLEKLCLNHVYHRIIHAGGVNAPNPLSGLPNLRHLTIANESIDTDKDFNHSLTIEYDINLTVSVFSADLTSIANKLETLKLKGRYSLAHKMFPSFETLVNLKRLSISSVILTKYQVSLLLQSKTLVQLSARFTSDPKMQDNAKVFKISPDELATLYFFIENNKTVRYLKVYRFEENPSMHLLKAIRESPVLEDVRFTSLIQNKLLKQPKHKTKLDYQPQPSQIQILLEELQAQLNVMAQLNAMAHQSA